MTTRGVLPRLHGGLVVLGLWALSGCSDDSRAPFITSGGDTPAPVGTGKPSGPRVGASCERPGESIACGEVVSRSDESVTCSLGSRLCEDDKTWGECVGERTRRVASGPSSALALNDASPCENPCDPDCKRFLDDGANLDADLPSVLCETGGGIGVCPSCGYDVTHAEPSSVHLPADFFPESLACSSDDDCSFDRQCRQGTCQNWRYPCSTPETSCAESDFTLGPPCLTSATNFHIPVCNRGRVRADTGVVRIGVHTQASRIGACAATDTDPPDAGMIEFALSDAPGRFIEPGKCVDVTRANSTQFGLDLTGVRALSVNLDGALPDCKSCNNWQAFDPGATCTGCVGLQCNQDCASTSLVGTILDPAQVNPIPNAMVYVPNSALLDFSEGVGCDTCESIVSGSPITSTLTKSDGSFELGNVPADVAFPLVIQTGRFRRLVQVAAIPGCTVAQLPPEAAHLPRNRAEGDIPRIAVLLGDGDPLQCLLRKIGFSESEFSASGGEGRIQLFNHNGMRFGGSREAFADPMTGPVALLNDPAEMSAYNLILAPCDNLHSYPAELTLQQSGPSYNSEPQPTSTPSQRANMRVYLDSGGRLLTTHHLSQDFVHQTFYPPSTTRGYYTPSESPLLQSLGWRLRGADAYNLAAPTVHLFGRNVEQDRGGPALTYDIDTSSSVGKTFAEWAQATGASTADDETLTLERWFHSVDRVRAPAIALTRGDSTQLGREPQACLGDRDYGEPGACRDMPEKVWAGPHVGIFQFDTPWRSANQCGRVVAAQNHFGTAQCRPSTTSPPDCSGPTPDCACTDLSLPGAWDSSCGPSLELTQEERAFEFLLFQATQCLGQPAAPQVPVQLEDATFTRDYEATCSVNETLNWTSLSWQAWVPGGTRIVFYVQTADTKAGLGSAPRVRVAQQTVDTWTVVSSAQTVQRLLETSNPPQTSRRFLRLSAEFKTNGGYFTPILTQWEQAYDCADLD